MSHAEREIVEMLRADAAKHPVLVKYIQAIESGAHLRPKSKRGSTRSTRQLTTADIMKALEELR